MNKDTPTAAKPFEELTDEEKIKRLYRLMEQISYAVNELTTRLDMLDAHSHQGGRIVVDLMKAKKVKEIHPVLDEWL